VFNRNLLTLVECFEHLCLKGMTGEEDCTNPEGGSQWVYASKLRERPSTV
jgi:hypothetical protein